MVRKEILIIIVLLLFINRTSSEIIHVDAGKYFATGLIKVDYEGYMPGWWQDTITFSFRDNIKTSITLRDFGLPDMSIDYSAHAGGIVFIDSTAIVGYNAEFSQLFKKVYVQDSTVFVSQDYSSYCLTIDNPDINWNEALVYPQDITGCDTFIVKNATESCILKARAVYTIVVRGQVISEWNSFALENHSAIIYIQASNSSYKVHLKLQIARVNIRSEYNPDSNIWDKFLASIELRWAADSLGNGKFKHDPVEIHKETAKNDLFSGNEEIIINNLEHGAYLSVRNFDPKIKSGQVEIFDLKGKRLIKKHVDFSESVPLIDYQNGIYIIKLVTTQKSIVKKLVLSR